MWHQNFMFTQDGTTPIEKTENELFHDIPQALDSAALNGERYISVWVQGDEEKGKPVAYTNVYARTAILDIGRQTGMLQPLQGRSHQIKKLLSEAQKTWIKEWLMKTAAEAWDNSEDSFKMIFEEE
ncbi:MAG: hypothetical protein HY284_01900 [Nitrospirae bacterium]|jgi:hypothetical protein|nr:hypothetical protein [Nitrospirota bacterium]